MEYREQIEAYIEGKREEMLEDLCTLVRIDSQKGEAQEGMPYGEGPARALAAAAGLLGKYGLSVRNYGNCVVTGDYGEGEKELDILAHLDVVPVTEDWTVTAPFEPKVVGERIYGRGTADDKGPAIAALYAVRAVKELGIPLKKSVRLILGSDEECGSSDLLCYYAQEKEAPCTFTPDASFPLINIEKGRFAKPFSAAYADNGALPRVVSLKSGLKGNVVPQRAEAVVEGLGRAAVEECAQEVSRQSEVAFQVEEENGAVVIRARGQSAHASTPQEGRNALTAMLLLISRLPLADSEGLRRLTGLQAMFPHGDTSGKALGISRSEPQSGDLTMCFSILDYTPESLRGEFDARLPIGCSAANTSEPVAAAFASCGMEIGDKEISDPHCVPGDSPFVQTLLACYESYTGIAGKPLAVGGGTYVHNLERGVAFGCEMPGIDNHMHGDDEFMEIGVLLMSAKIFADAIVRICG